MFSVISAEVLVKWKTGPHPQLTHAVKTQLQCHNKWI